MCARFTLRKKKLRDVADALDAEFSADDESIYRPRYNVAPTDVAWIVELGETEYPASDLIDAHTRKVSLAQKILH